jgi:predicted permease
MTLAFGLVPLIVVQRRDSLDALRAPVSTGPARRTTQAQRVGVAAQIAVALLLTMAGGLLFRSFVALLRVDPGYRPDRVLALRVDPAGRIPPRDRARFFANVLDSVATVPGLDSVAIAIGVPMDRNFTFDVALPGEATTPGQPSDGAYARMVSPRYFRTVGIPLIEGRDFDTRDQSQAPGVVIINQSLARRLEARGLKPLGTSIRVGARNREVVAIAGDVQSEALNVTPRAEVYLPYTQAPGWQAYDLVVRSSESSIAMVPAVREAVWRVDRQQAIGNPVPLQELIDRTIRPHRVLTSLLVAFAAGALLLAALGVYSTVNYGVAQRLKEVAIRIAVGAPGWRVTWMIMRETLVFAVFGVVLGIPLGLMAARMLRGFLFGVEATDATALVLGPGVLIAIAVMAAFFPARRTTQVDPAQVLRAE